MAVEEVLVSSALILIPFAGLLGFFIARNRFAHAAAGILSGSFVLWVGWDILRIDNLHLLGSEMVSLFTIGALFSLLFGAGGVLRQGGSLFGGPAPGPGPGPPPTPGNGVITGVVQDDTTNNPVPGLVVRVRGTGTISPATGADGVFRVEVPQSRFWGYVLTFDHPHYLPGSSGHFSVRVRANERVDLGIIRLRRRIPPVAHPVTPVLLDGSGSPRTTNTVFPGDWVTVAFRLAPGLSLAVPLGLAGGNPDRFELQDDTGRQILRHNIPNDPINYPGGNEVRFRCLVPTRYPTGGLEALPFSDIPVRIIPRIQFV